MFSEPIRDRVERGPERYYKRANTKHPEFGGRVREWVQVLWQRRELVLERGASMGSERQADRDAARERPTLDLPAIKARGRAASDRWRERLQRARGEAKQQALELN